MKPREKSSIPFLEYLSIISIFVAILALALVRIGPTDTPWHLATARYAFSAGDFLGNWPSTNTFSHTFPDYPLFQQYPLYQALIYKVFSFFSWEGLSIFHAAMWIAIGFIWIVWVGGLRKLANYHVVLCLLALGLHQRMFLRPFVLSLPIFLLILIAIDRYRYSSSKQQRIAYGFAIVGLQALLCLTHQMFPLGILVQIAFLVHVLLTRHVPQHIPISRADAKLSPTPLALICTASLASCMLNPLGHKVFLVPFRTAVTMTSLKHDIYELQPLTESYYATTLFFLFCGGALFSLWRQRKNIEAYECALFLFGIIFGISSWRGIGFASVLLLGVALKLLPIMPLNKNLSLTRMIHLTLSISFAIFVVFFRWVDSPKSLNAPQTGIGQALGQWPSSSMSKIVSDTPPGKMANLSWYAGNFSLFYLYPKVKTFSDPRFESYPPAFLLSTMQAEKSDVALNALIAEHDISWMVLETTNNETLQIGSRLLTKGDWHLVAVDTRLFVLVKNGPATKSYIQKNQIDPLKVQFSDLLTEHPELHAQQKRIVEHWFKAFHTERS